MRDPARIRKVLEMINAYWSVNPDLRFFQMIESLKSQIHIVNDPFYLEDDDLMLQIEDMFEEHENQKKQIS